MHVRPVPCGTGFSLKLINHLVDLIKTRGNDMNYWLLLADSAWKIEFVAYPYQLLSQGSGPAAAIKSMRYVKITSPYNNEFLYGRTDDKSGIAFGSINSNNGSMPCHMMESKVAIELAMEFLDAN